MSIFLAALLLQAASGASPATTEIAVARPDDAKIVCKTVTATGSRLGGKRTCLSKKEWRRLQRDSEDTVREYQDHQSKQPGNE
jgi:hypothetical protein